MNIILLTGGLIITLLSANALVAGASSIAKRFNLSDMVIGLTIVSIGTSTPELVVSVVSACKDNTDIAVGNILGSNIANILLILGIAAIIYPIVINKDTQSKDIPLGILAVALIGICGNDIFLDQSPINIISRSDGIILFCFFAIFLYYTFQITPDENAPIEHVKESPLWKSILYVFCGVGGLYIGGEFLIEGAVAIARRLGMSDNLIGLTVLAIGTSLPELATSIVAATKKNADIIVGNIVGSNIINIFLILGITATIHPLPMNPPVNFDISIALFASLLLFLSTFVLGRRKITRLEGGIFLLSYVAYLTYRIVSS